MAQAKLGVEPTIDPTATVRDSQLGAWTEVGARTKVIETTMGDYSYVVNDSDIIYTTIGKFVNIAAFTRINPGQHPMDRASMHHFMYRSAAYDMGEDDQSFFDWRRSMPCVIGHDVWIGNGAIVQSGVSIGTGAVVGSGAIVTKDVPDYAIVVGNPARVLRFRHPEPLQKALKALAWWDWDHDTLSDRMDDFRSLSAEAFCTRYA